MRILYVEDNRELRETIGMLMEGEGRTVFQCETGEQALEADRLDPFDVVVTDISLPGISGTELARRVLAEHPERWVVLCSGYEYGDALQAMGPRVRALPKPFELDDLERLMQEIHLSLGGTV